MYISIRAYVCVRPDVQAQLQRAPSRQLRQAAQGSRGGRGHELLEELTAVQQPLLRRGNPELRLNVHAQVATGPAAAGQDFAVGAAGCSDDDPHP